ncbi:hypothetical protein Tco_1395249 [Tanacetum coccineum]
MLLVQAQESGVILDEEKIAFLVDLGVAQDLDTQTILPINAAFRTVDLDAFDSDCDEAPSARAVLMANLFSYDYDVILEVPISDTFQDNFVLDHCVQKINAKFVAFENEIHTLKLRLSKNMENNKTLTTTMDVLKKETKEKEDKYIEEIVDLEKKKKDLDNIVYEVGQSVQTMHMLMKP